MRLTFAARKPLSSYVITSISSTPVSTTAVPASVAKSSKTS
jgi:hypothetical protein